jgi:hypothetical protein
VRDGITVEYRVWNQFEHEMYNWQRTSFRFSEFAVTKQKLNIVSFFITRQYPISRRPMEKMGSSSN